MEEKNIDRKKLEIIIIVIATVLIAIFSVSYAFFQEQIGSPANSNVNISTGTPDDLRFNVDKDISISVNQFNFGVGAGNQSDSAVASATLLANSTNNTANYTYFVYFRINTNEYIYTTTDNKPEIILTVTDPNGNEVTNIDGLTYVENIQTPTSSGTTQTVSGFDITTTSGTFAVASNYSITSNSSTSATKHEWNFTATFINLDSDQVDNTGKTLDAEIIIQQNELMTTLADLCNGLTLSECITTQVYDESNEEATGLYYHDADLANGAGDNSYRYAGANPNNYVCFGSDASTCPSDNLYRIIGVFGSEVKLIKYDYANSNLLGTNGDYYGNYGSLGSYYKGSLTSVNGYYWNASGSNTWSESNLNTVNLNTNFLNNIGSIWSNKIANHDWKVGGGTYQNLAYGPNGTPKNAYNYEVGSSSSSTTYQAKIGLMYVSDYYYGASPTYWIYPGYTSSSYPNSSGNYGSSYDYRAATGSNWMYMGMSEWTISRSSSNSDYVFSVTGTGDVYTYYVRRDNYAVRPAFYLESSTEYVSGSGTQFDPIRIQ